MSLLSLSDYKGLTRLDHRRIAQRLSSLEHEIGPKNAKLYESSEALPLLYLDENLDATKERARLTHHQANIAALDERARSGELVSREEVLQDWASMIAAAKAKLLSMPAKLSTIIASLDDPYEIQAHMEAEVHGSLSELYAKYVNEESGGDELEPAPETEG